MHTKTAKTAIWALSLSLAILCGCAGTKGKGGVAGIFMNRGIEFASSGKFDRAVEEFTETVKLSPNSAQAHAFRARALLATAAKVLYMDDGFSRIDVLTISEATPEQARILELAIADLNRAIQLEPKNTRYYAQRATIYINMGEYDRAFADADLAVKLNPNCPHAHHVRGSTYLQEKKYVMAAVDFSRAIKLKPDLVEAYNDRAITFSEAGQTNRAIEDYTIATNLRPDIALLYSNRAYEYFTQAIACGCGGCDKIHDNNALNHAFADIEQVIKLTPEDAGAYYIRGLIHHHKKEYGQAIADFNRTIELTPDYICAYHDRGKAHYDNGDLDNAIADFEAALRIDFMHAGVESLLIKTRERREREILELQKAQAANEDSENDETAEVAEPETKNGKETDNAPETAKPADDKRKPEPK